MCEEMGLQPISKQTVSDHRIKPPIKIECTMHAFIRKK